MPRMRSFCEGLRYLCDSLKIKEHPRGGLRKAGSLNYDVTVIVRAVKFNRRTEERRRVRLAKEEGTKFTK